MIRYGHDRQKGLTAIEITVVVAIVAILLSLSGTFAGRMAGQADLKAAEESVLDALQIARNLSRSAESSLTLTFAREVDDGAYTISFASPDGRNIGPGGMDVPEIPIPESVVVLAEYRTFLFDPRGLVEPTGSIVLRSKSNDDETRTVIFAN